MRKLPETIVIGPLTYKVIQISDDQVTSLKGLYGEHHQAKQEIHLYTNHRSDERIAETLVHEMLHAVWDLWDIQDEDTEERVVTSLAYGIGTIMKHNPGLFAYISKLAEAGK